MNLNQVTLMGRVTTQPTLETYTDKHDNHHTVSVFKLAVKEGDNWTNYIPITTFGSTAENLVKYVTKGSLVTVLGTVNCHYVTTNKGNKELRLRIKGTSVIYCDEKLKKEDTYEMDNTYKEAMGDTTEKVFDACYLVDNREGSRTVNPKGGKEDE